MTASILGGEFKHVHILKVGNVEACRKYVQIGQVVTVRAVQLVLAVFNVIQGRRQIKAELMMMMCHWCWQPSCEFNVNYVTTQSLRKCVAASRFVHRLLTDGVPPSEVIFWGQLKGKAHFHTVMLRKHNQYMLVTAPSGIGLIVFFFLCFWHQTWQKRNIIEHFKDNYLSALSLTNE